jgi:hypothetical protein
VIGDRDAADAYLREGTVGHAMTARGLAPENVTARPTEGVRRRLAELSLACGIEANDPVIGVDLEDEIGRAVHDRAEFVAFLF